MEKLMINEILQKAIETAVNRKFEEEKKKQTLIRPTTICKVNTDGTYQVILDGYNYNVQSSLDIKLKPYQNVWVIIPHGKMEWMHIYGIRK